MRRPDYAPMRCPPNPHEQQARSDMIAYNAQMRGDTVTVELCEEAQPPDPAASLIAACLARPGNGWLARYAETARLEPHVCNETGRLYQFVTVTVYDAAPAAPAADAAERAGKE